MFLPLTILGLGLMIWKTHPPFGDPLGYRTAQSQKSPEAWELSQALFGRYCTLTYAVLSGITLIASVIPLLFQFDDIVASWIVCVANIVDFLALFVVIGVVDHTVKKALSDVKGDMER